MKTTAYWCFICTVTLAVAALWLFSADKAQADTLSYTSTSSTDTVITSTITDNSSYPNITANLDCSGSDIDDMITQCRQALQALCPDGGTVSDLGETGPGVLPARIVMTLACRHEPGM